MTTWIAFLRGVNVGGKNMLSMKMLVPTLATLGVEDAAAYLQSGNLIFRSTHSSATEVEKSLQLHLKEAFGMTIPVVVRTSVEVKQTLADNPFPFDENAPTTTHVFLLSEPPTAENLAKLDFERSPGDTLVAIGKDIFLKVKERSSDSKFSNDYVAKTLKVTSTARNWKTMRSIGKLIDQREL